MGYRNFDELLDALKTDRRKAACAVVSPESDNILEAVFKAYREGIVEPLMIGNERIIRPALEKNGIGIEDIRVVPAVDPSEAAQLALDLVKSGQADIFMKGNINTSIFLRPLFDKVNGLKPEKILSQFSLFQIPTYHKLVGVTDGGIVINPTLEQKKMIIENAVAALRHIGIPCPKVAVLAALEVPTPKMPDTMEAAELQKMNERGEIKNCIVSGPISYDLAVNRESAEIKGFESPVAGDADLLVYPNMLAGNLVSKTLILTAGATPAMFAIGVKQPIIFGSRSSPMEYEFLSLVIASALSRS